VIVGAILLGLLIAAAAGMFRASVPASDSRWLFIGAFVAGNLLLVATHSTALGLLGVLVMLGGLSGLVVSSLRGRRA
jgi:hypothetical protein